MDINNEVYDRMAQYWWDENECGTLATIRTFVNSARFNYFNSVLENEYHNNFQKLHILDVGCGGGFLSEEFSKIGLIHMLAMQKKHKTSIAYALHCFGIFSLIRLASGI